MPLTLVTGPANSAKAGAVLGAYRAELDRDRDPFLVVPTGADAAHYRRELATERTVLGGTVGSFAAWVRVVAMRTDLVARTVRGLARERLIAAAVAEANLVELARSARAAGFLVVAGELFAELARSLVTPGALIRALAAWGREEPGRAAHAAEVGRLYAGYVRRLEAAGRVDEDGLAWRALDALRAAPERWGAGPVLFYGFDDLSPLQRDAVETLARVVGVEVTVSLPYEAGRNAFAGRARTFEELRPLADRIEALPARPDFYAPGSRAALHHLERGLFEDAPQPIAPGAAVALLEAGGERGEVELVAARVLDLLRAGVAPGEVAVVFRAPGRVASLVEQVFAAYDIPLEVERRVPAAHTALGRALVALARCALAPEGAGAADLLAYLRAPGLVHRAELVDRLEAALARAGEDGLDAARARWEEAHPSWPLDAIDRVRRATGDPARLCGELGRQAAWLFAAPRRGRAARLGPGEALEAAALRTLAAGLDELASVGGAVLGLPARELPEALARLEVRLRTGQGGVLLADPLAIRARRFRAVFACGMQEGEFPVLGRPEPFLGDEERRALARAGGVVLPPRQDALAEERYLFYACASRAQERLFLSYRDSDEEGNPAARSAFVDDVAVLFGRELRGGRARRPLSEVTWPLDAAPTEEERARAAAAAAPPDPAAAIAPLGAAAAARLRQRAVLSAGALERYAACPVRWLVESELEPEELAPPADPLRRGTLAHDVLERVLDRLRAQRGTARLDRASLPAAERLLSEALAGAEAGRGPVEAAMRHGVEADLRRYLRHEAETGAGWEPVHLELGFGMEQNGRPPLVLDDGRLALRGRVDRVDVDPAGRRALVRDYKSGRKDFRHHGSHWLAEDQLQVALYLLAVRQHLGLDLAGGVYQPLRGPKLTARGLLRAGSGLPTDTGAYQGSDVREDAEFEAALTAAADRAVELARGLRAGELRPCPETCSRRGGCTYPGICRSTA